MTPVTVEQGGWRKPVVVTRLALFIYSGSIALCFVLIIGFGVWYLLDRRATVNERSKNQAAEIQKLQKITDQIRTITSPTPQEYKVQLKKGIERCLKEAECRKLFPTIDGGGQ
jgi:uncharacterized protein HemX